MGKADTSVLPHSGFRTAAGLAVLAITAAQMRKVDYIAVEEFGLGRRAARHVPEPPVAVVHPDSADDLLAREGRVWITSCEEH